MGLTNWFKQPTKAEQAYSGFEAFVLPAHRDYYATAGTDAALSIATVYRSVDIISNNVSQMNLETYKGDEKVQSPLLVRQPDTNRSLSAFLKRTATCLALHGNAFWFKTLNSSGQVANIEVLNPLSVQVIFDDKGRKNYLLGDKTYTDKNVVHLRKSEIPGHDLGVGPLEAYKNGINTTIALGNFNSRTLANRGIPTGILRLKTELNEEQASALKDRWNEVVSDGGIAVIDRDTEFDALSLSASDIEFIASTKMSDLQIARIFGIPAAFLDLEVGGTSLTYQNLGMLNRQFLQNTLISYVVEIEDALSSCLPRGTHVKFDVSALLRADEATEINERATNVATAE